MRDLPDRPVFTHLDAQRLGWTHAALKHAVHTGRLTRLRRGVYSSAGRPDALHAAIGAALATPHAVISHRSAALVHGLPIVGSGPALPELTVPPRANANVPRVHLHRATVQPHDVAVVGGVRVTSVARTLVDIGRRRPTSTAVVALDSALHRRLVTSDQLDRTLLDCWNWPGIRRAQRAVRLADGCAESPLESVSRLTIRWLRLPLPRPQAVVLDADGRFLGRCDFYWDGFGVVGEADGRSKYDDRTVLTAEKDRQETLEDTGLVVVRWGWPHVARRPQEMRAKILRAFDRGRARDRSGLPRLWRLGEPQDRYN